MEQPIRSTISEGEVYVIFDSNFVYLFVGRQCSPHYLRELFEVEQLNMIALNRTEDQIFSQERMAESEFLTSLYGLINQIRYQRQPFCSLKVLVAGDM